MPLFNYKCNICDRKFEELVRSSDEKVICPHCKSESVKKVLPTRLGSTGSGSNSSSSSSGGGFS